MLILLAMAAVGILITDGGREKITQTQREVKAKTSFIRTLQVELAALLPGINDAPLKAKIEKLAEAVRYSDPVSDDRLLAIEKAMAEQLALLRQYAAASPADAQASTPSMSARRLQRGFLHFPD